MKNREISAVELLRRRYIGDDEALQAELERELANARIARRIYDARKRAGLTQLQLAKLVGTTQSVISRLEDADYQGHTIRMLNRIAHALGEDLRVAISADELAAQIEAGGDGGEDEIAGVVAQCPVKEMVQRDWIPGETLQDLRDSVRRFLWPFRRPTVAQFRRSGASKCDDAALICWLKKLEIEGERVSVPKFRATGLRSRLPELVRLSAQRDGPAKGVAWLEEQGVRCVFIRHLAQTYLDGAVMLLDDGGPVIGMTLRHDRLDNFWFTLLHEIGHLLRHKRRLGDQAIIDEEIDPGSDDPIESEANRFAANAWVSARTWGMFRKQHGVFIPKVAIADFARHLRVTPALVAGRLRYELKRYTHYKGFLGQGQAQAAISKHYPIF